MQRLSWELIMQAKRIIGWTIAVFLVYYLVTQPQGAGHAIGAVLNWLKNAGSSLATFLNSI